MQLSIFVVFISGALSFFSPCILPLIPSFLTLITGVSLYELEKGERNTKMLSKLFAFCAGFSFVFISLGAAVSALGQSLLGMQHVFDLVAGVVLLIMALHMLKVFEIPMLYRDVRFRMPRGLGGMVGAFIVGMVFSLGWTPCVGPILGAVLAIASESATISKGVFLLAVYSAGLAVPFILIGMFLSKAIVYLRFMTKYLQIIERISGSLIGAIALWFLYRGLHNGNLF